MKKLKKQMVEQARSVEAYAMCACAVSLCGCSCDCGCGCIEGVMAYAISDGGSAGGQQGLSNTRYTSINGSQNSVS